MGQNRSLSNAKSLIELKQNRYLPQMIYFSSETTLKIFMSVPPSVCLSICPSFLGGNAIFSALIKIEVWFLWPSLLMDVVILVYNFNQKWLFAPLGALRDFANLCKLAVCVHTRVWFPSLFMFPCQDYNNPNLYIFN